MDAKNSFWQFVKDGLVGVAVVIIIFGILIIRISSMGMPTLNGQPDNALTLSRYVVIVLSYLFLTSPMGAGFINPMPFVLLIVFIGCGLSGPFIEGITSRKGWIKPMIIINLISWLEGGILFIILFLLTAVLQRGTSVEFDMQSFLKRIYDVTRAVLSTSGFGAIAGLVIGCLAGLIFNPGRRLNKIIIVSVSIALVSLANGIGLILIQGRE